MSNTTQFLNFHKREFVSCYVRMVISVIPYHFMHRMTCDVEPLAVSFRDDCEFNSCKGSFVIGNVG